MKNKMIQSIGVLLFIILLFSLSDPFMYWMPEMMTMVVLLLVTFLMCLWAGFILSEDVVDERERAHRMQAGRAAYLSGLVILTVAFVVQGFNHQIDPWVSLALGSMVLVNLIIRWYHDFYR
mgnify:CR=1 FL=1